MELKLTDEHRAILFNQYKILSIITPDEDEKAYYQRLAEALKNGYEHAYEDLGIYESFGAANCKEVADTLRLFRILQNSYEKLSPAEKNQLSPEQLKFRGYDGHGHNGFHFELYVRFLHSNDVKEKEHEGNESWISQISTDTAKHENFDSHSSGIRTTYQQMLAKWRERGSPDRLNLEQIKQIVPESVK